MLYRGLQHGAVDEIVGVLTFAEDSS